MKKTAIFLLLAIAGINASQAIVYPSEPGTYFGLKYYHYPNGYIDESLDSPVYVIKESDPLLYPEDYDEVSVLIGQSPAVNTTTLRSNFKMPDIVEIEGKFYPVCGIMSAFNHFDAESLIIPDIVSYLGYSAFQGAKCKSITLPASLKLIEQGAFKSASDIKEVYFRSNIPPAYRIMTYFGDVIVDAEDSIEDFYYTSPKIFTSSDPMIYVPAGSIDAYRHHPSFADSNLKEYSPELP